MCKLSYCSRPVNTPDERIVYCEMHGKYKDWATNAPSRPWLFYKVEKIFNNNLVCEGCGFDAQRVYGRPMEEVKHLYDVDHIDPSIKGNMNVGEIPSNYQLLCKNCHGLKTHDDGDWIRKR